MTVQCRYSSHWVNVVSIKLMIKLTKEFLSVVCILIFAGKKVWDEVAEHSKEFIQEYLEEFPNV